MDQLELIIKKYNFESYSNLPFSSFELTPFPPCEKQLLSLLYPTPLETQSGENRNESTDTFATHSSSLQVPLAGVPSLLSLHPARSHLPLISRSSCHIVNIPSNFQTQPSPTWPFVPPISTISTSTPLFQSRKKQSPNPRKPSSKPSPNCLNLNMFCFDQTPTSALLKECSSRHGSGMSPILE